MAMGIFKVIILLLCLLETSLLFADSRYRVRRGDTLSQLAARFYIGRIYGRGGSLERVLRENPHISNPDLIVENQYLNFESENKIAVIEKSPPSQKTAKEAFDKAEAFQKENPKTPQKIATIPEKPEETPEESPEENIDPTEAPTVTQVQKENAPDKEIDIPVTPQKKPAPELQQKVKFANKSPKEIAKALGLENPNKAIDIDPTPRRISKNLAQAEPARVQYVKPKPRINSTSSHYTFSNFTIDTIMSYRRLDAQENSAQASALSRLSYGAELHWWQHWSKDLRTFVSTRFSRFSYAVGSANTLAEPTHFLSDFALGTRFLFNENHSVDAAFNLLFEHFLIGSNEGIGALAIEKLRLPAVNLRSQNVFWRTQNFSIGADLEAHLFFPGSGGEIQSRLSQQYTGALTLGYQQKWALLRAKAFYATSRIVTDESNQSTKELGILLGIDKEF